MQQLTTEHHFFYNSKGPVTATMLAESLVGLDGLAQQSARVLASLLETKFHDASVIVQTIEIGSYKDSFMLRMLFGKDEDMERSLDKLRQKLNLKNMTLPKLASVLLIAVAGYGVLQFATSRGDRQATIHIENSFNDWGGNLGMSKEELIALLKDTVQNAEVVKKHVVRVAHPDGSDSGGDIEIRGGGETFTIPSQAVVAVPREYGKEKPKAPEIDRDNVQIVIRAADLDRMKTGWAAIAAEISDKRLPVILGEGVDPSRAPIGKYTLADVTVIYKTDRHGNETPRKLLIRKLHEQLQPGMAQK